VSFSDSVDISNRDFPYLGRTHSASTVTDSVHVAARLDGYDGEE